MHRNRLSVSRDALGGEAAMGSPGTQLGRKKGTEVCPLFSPLELIPSDHITHFVGPKEPRSTLEGARKHIWDEE